MSSDPPPQAQRSVGRSQPPPSDVELKIREALEDEDIQEALRIATLHYREAMIRFARAFVNDEHVAEDVAQTALAVAAEKALTFSWQSTFRTWLFGIARHKALDAIEARHGLPLSAVSDSRWIASAMGPATGLQREDDLRKLTDVLALLGDDTRALLALRFREELSYKEIGDAFEISEVAARKRMFDAIEKMRKLLEKLDGGFFEDR